MTYSEETAKQRPENFLDALSNSGPAVRLYSEGRGILWHSPLKVLFLLA